MKKFEYKIIRFTAGKLTELDILNGLGKEGWEVCGVLFHLQVLYYYVKREKPTKLQRLLKFLKLI